MSFFYPNFLYALCFLAIPIIIHLFQFRKFKVVRFSKIDFLEEVEDQNNSISKLKHLLILLSRLLAIAFLVLAFARPYIPSFENVKDLSKQKVVGIYIDNSFSMNTENDRGVLLDEAIKKCTDLIKNFPLDQQYVILTNEFSNESSRVLDKSKALDLLQTVENTSSIRSLSEIDKRFKSVSEDLNEAYLFSDFQKSTVGLDQFNESSMRLFMVKIERIVNINVSIDSLAFSQPIHFVQQFNKNLDVFLSPFAVEESREINAELYLNKKLITPSQFSIKDKSLTEELKFASNEEEQWNTGFLKIDDYPMTFDDTLFFNYKNNHHLNVLHLYDGEYLQGLSSLFGKDSTVNYRLMISSKIDYSQFDNQQLIILDELDIIASGLKLELIKYLSEGGKICIIPSTSIEGSKSDLADISGIEFLKKETAEGMALRGINNNSYIFQNVFDDIPQNLRLPKVDSLYELRNSALLNKEEIISLEDNSAFLSLISTDQNHHIYLFSAPLSVNESFQNNALFVPTFYNMAISGFKARPLFHYLNDEAIKLEHKLSKETPIYIKLGEKKLIPYQQNTNGTITIKLNNLKLKAGNYPVFFNDSLIDYLSLNYTRTESDLSAYKLEELKSALEIYGIENKSINSNENFDIVLESQSIGEEYWRYALLLSLVFFIIEIALLRLMNPIT